MARISNYLVEIQAFTGDEVETLYLSTQPFTSGPSDDPPNQQYIAAIDDLGTFDRSFAEDDGTFGAPSVNYGFIGLSNANGRFDGWQFYGFGRPFVIKDLVSPRARAASAPVIFSGIIQGIDTSDARSTFRLRVRDRMAALNLPLLTERYAGTTTGSGATAEGNVDLKDVIKPRIWGNVGEGNAPCKPVNTFNLLYQVSNSVVDSIAVYDVGLALTNDGDSVDLTALNAASIAAGHYRTCLALGIFRLGFSPAQVTADVIEGGSAENRSAVRVAQRMLEFYGETLDTDSFDAIYGDIDDEVGIVVSDESTVLANVAQVLASIEAAVLPNIDQELELVRLVNPTDASPVATLTQADLDKDGAFALLAGPLKEGDGIPAYSIVINWGKIWQTQTGGDLAGAVSDDRRALLALPTRQVSTDLTITDIRSTYPNAPQITMDTLLVDRTDAVAAETRRYALYSSAFRRRLTFPVQRSRADYDIGAILRVDIDRYGFAGGQNVIVIDRIDDFTKRLVTYTLWG